MSQAISLHGGIDIGNGYVKARFEPSGGGDKVTVDIPSADAVINHPNLSPAPLSDLPRLVHSGQLATQLDAQYSTPMVLDSNRRLIGRAAVNVGADGLPGEFDVVSAGSSKADQPLAGVLALGSIASAALSIDGGNNPERLVANGLDVDAVIAVALPIDEYLSKHDVFESRFVNHGQPHVVTVCLFAQRFDVRITIRRCIVTAEGAAAITAVRDMPPAMHNALARAAKESDPDDIGDITGRDIADARNIIGIDIGEGTVNFPVYIDGKFNVNASATYQRGWGNVLEDALKTMAATGPTGGFETRKQLAEYLLTEPSAFQRTRYNRVMHYVDEAAGYFAQHVATEFSKVITPIGGSLDVAYVYGGGSQFAMNRILPALREAANRVVLGLPVLPLAASWSRSLNCVGLFSMAKAADKRD